MFLTALVPLQNFVRPQAACEILQRYQSLSDKLVLFVGLSSRMLIMHAVGNMNAVVQCLGVIMYERARSQGEQTTRDSRTSQAEIIRVLRAYIPVRTCLITAYILCAGTIMSWRLPSRRFSAGSHFGRVIIIGQS